MPLRIYDTLTREKREFVPVRPGEVGMYVCGMTVQDRPHVGHIRASLSGEVMRRYLEHLGGGGGFFNMMRIYPDLGVGVLAMGNSTKYDHRAIAAAATP